MPWFVCEKEKKKVFITGTFDQRSCNKEGDHAAVIWGWGQELLFQRMEWVKLK